MILAWILIYYLGYISHGAVASGVDFAGGGGGLSVPQEMKLAALPTRVPEPVSNQASNERIELGRLLFFDPILSGDQNVSCATCHDPATGWADGRSLPIGVGGDGRGPRRLFRHSGQIPLLDRNTPSLINVAFNGLVTGQPLIPENSPMFWDSRVSGLEAQALVPIRSRAEMMGEKCEESQAVDQALERLRAVAEYRELFRFAFKDDVGDPVTTIHLARALACFERSLVVLSTAFDEYVRGNREALNAQQLRGMQIFREAGCQQCHGGPMFSDFRSHFLGLQQGNSGTARAFRTPTLRNLKMTAPYMHDGSIRTLREVLQFYEELSDRVSETLDGGDLSTQPPLDPLLKNLKLSADDFADLEAFLLALSSENYDRSVPARVPSGLPVLR